MKHVICNRFTRPLKGPSKSFWVDVYVRLPEDCRIYLNPMTRLDASGKMELEGDVLERIAVRLGKSDLADDIPLDNEASLRLLGEEVRELSILEEATQRAHRDDLWDHQLGTGYSQWDYETLLSSSGGAVVEIRKKQWRQFIQLIRAGKGECAIGVEPNEIAVFCKTSKAVLLSDFREETGFFSNL